MEQSTALIGHLKSESKKEKKKENKIDHDGPDIDSKRLMSETDRAYSHDSV